MAALPAHLPRRLAGCHRARHHRGWPAAGLASLLLAAGMLAGWSPAVVAAARTGQRPADPAPARTAAAPPRTAAFPPIRHVVEIVLENHTFDDLFAGWPGAGIPPGTTVLDPRRVGARLAPIVAPPSEGDVQAGMDNSRSSELFALDARSGHDRMDRFALVPGSGLSAVTTFAPSLDPNLQALAAAGTLAVDNFQPVIGPTEPNLLEALAGTAGGATTNGLGAGAAPARSIFTQLIDSGHRAKMYWGVPGTVLAGSVWPALLPPGAAGDLATTSGFLADARRGTLPAFSLVRPGVGYSEEPPEDVGEGDAWLGQLVAALERSPDWASTAVFVTYDEGGGFYDHVPPPAVTPYGYGTRTPMVIVSPWARRSVLRARTTDLSVLAFVEHLFGLPALTPLVARQDDLLAAFRDGGAPGPAPAVPVDPRRTLAVYGSSLLADPPALRPGAPATLLVAAETSGLAIYRALSGAVRVRVVSAPGTAPPVVAPLVLVRGMGELRVVAPAPGYDRLQLAGPGGSLGFVTLDVGTGPLTP